VATAAPPVPPDEPESELLPDPAADPVLSGEERLPPPAATPGPRRVTPRPASVYNGAGRESSPRPGRVTPRPSLSGPELRPIPRSQNAANTPSPRSPMGYRRLAGEGAPAAPRPGTGIAYPMPGMGTGIGTGMDGALEGDAPPPPGMPRPPAPVHLSPRMTAVFGGLFGLAIFTSVVSVLIQSVPPRNERAIIANTASGSGASGASSADAPPTRESAVHRRVRVALPGPWRLSELEKDPGITVVRGTMDRKSLFDALGEKGVPKSEVYRIGKALEGVRKFEKSRKKDRFAVALADKKVKAFEYEVSPGEVYQAREGDGGLLTGSRLDMKLAEEEFSGAFYVASDVAAAARAAGFEDGVLGALDEALTGHMSTEGFEEGGTVRVIAVEETALGLFSRYKRVVAMEYRPADPAGKPVRIYSFNGQEAHGYWSDKGRQPSSGGWRSPVPGAAVTSPFNPKRLHPVLHTVMPHTGTDFRALTGTPIYAAYRGVISTVGPLGPCGNAVQIEHPGNILTGYCHMSRFANIKAGEHVGTHQLIGFAGATGRVTGPHLHFFAKKNGVFFDAQTLHMDGDRAVPSADRAGFLAAKAELDRRLDAIPLPEPPPEAEKPAVSVPAVGSGEPAGDAPAVASGKEGKGAKEGKEGSTSRRGAMQVGSPEALAAARAEPGIHPSQLIESKGGDEDDDVSPPGSPPPPATTGKGKGKPDPADDEEEEK